MLCPQFFRKLFLKIRDRKFWFSSGVHPCGSMKNLHSVICFINFVLRSVSDYLYLLFFIFQPYISVGIVYFYYLFFPPSSHLQVVFFFSCRPFVINATFSTGLVVSSASWFRQLTIGVLFIFILFIYQ